MTSRLSLRKSPPLARITRRQTLSALGSVLLGSQLFPLLGCGAQPGSGTAGSSAAERVATWATGGTAALTGATPDAFEEGLQNACLLTCSSTLGPCYTDTIDRRDISEGQLGLPMRLALSVVDENCQPIEGVTVDVWHTSATGFYSGEDTAALCTLGNAAAEASKWFRGVQTTDDHGVVEFASCFPGWYGGRTLHIHFTIRMGDTEFVTSQLYFDDTLADEIIASEPVYSDRGARETTNQNDGVLGGSVPGSLLLATRKLPDGSLLAWKRLIVRTSAGAAPACA